ncbi:MAG: GlsB/YeaQ/YmgE family stress response membrane protein [Candidatus Levybacteria bacterium]|nr:GlsB/YeaQ/YmgE family stress response membrane protein [Candidatus Levybacteria bacterium]
MDLLLYVVFGGIVGWIASMVMGRDAQQGILGNIIVGIVGAFLGGFIMNTFGQTGVSGFNLYSFIVALLGSVVLLWLYSMFTSRRA